MARHLKPLITKVERLLANEFAAFRSGLEPAERADRVLGFIVSTDFKGLDHSVRQSKLKRVLQGGLSKDELVRVGPIVTMTPAEADVGEAAA